MANLVSMDAVRRAVGAADPEKDGELEELRAAVEADFDSLTGRSWRRKDGEEGEVFEVITREPGARCNDRLRTIWCPAPNVEEIAIEEKDWGGAFAEVDEADYHVSAAGGAIRRISRRWGDVVKLTATAGYTEATCPADIAGAILSQIQYSMVRSAGNAVALESQGADATSVRYLSGPKSPAFAEMVRRWAVARV